MAEHKHKKKHSSLNWYIIGDCVIIIVAWTASFVLQIYEAPSYSTRVGFLGNTAFFSIETFFLALMVVPGVTGLYAEIRASNCMMNLTFWFASIAVFVLFLRTFTYFAIMVYTMTEPAMENSCKDGPAGCVCKNATVWAGIFNTEASPRTCAYAQSVVDRLILACSINILSWFALLMLVILSWCSNPK